MPQLVTFQGRPVRRRRRVPAGIRLTLVSPLPGEPGNVIYVSQQEWLRDGDVQFFSKASMPNVRALASRFVS